MEATKTDIKASAINIARRYLKLKDYDLIDDTQDGVDIIATDGAETVLVKVQGTHLDSPCSPPPLMVDRQDAQRLRKTQLCYLMEHPDIRQTRCDVVSVGFHDENHCGLRHLIGVCSFDS